MPSTLIYWNMVLRNIGLKASKMCTLLINVATTWPDHLIVVENKNMSKSADRILCSFAALFTYNDQSMRQRAAQGIITILCEIAGMMRYACIVYK